VKNFQSPNTKWVFAAIGAVLAGRLIERINPIAGEIVSIIGALAVLYFGVRAVRDFQKLTHG